MTTTKKTTPRAQVVDLHDVIRVQGARHNNLKDVSVELPRQRLTVFTYEATLVSDDTPADRFLAGDVGALSALQQQGLNEFRAGGSQCTQWHQGPELSAAGVTSAANANQQDPRALGFFRTAVSAIEDDPGAAGVDAFGASTLEQVMEFYARNGDVPAGGNLANGFGNIRLTQQERAQIVEFLKALTDERVRYERAPFDHPSLCVPVGYQSTANVELFAAVASVGRNGNAAPLQTFAEQLAGIGGDGTRAHTLQERCVP